MTTRRLCIVQTLLATLALAPSGPVIAQCLDRDGDGFDAGLGCPTYSDCNDTNPWINPIASERCNGFDDDCDGTLDELCANSCLNPERRPRVTSVARLPGGSQYQPVVARGRNRTLISRAHWDATNCWRRVVSLVDDEGIEITTPIVLQATTPPSNALRESYAVWSGDRFVVFWSESPAEPGTCSKLQNQTYQAYAAVVAADGAVLVAPQRVSCPGTLEGDAFANAVTWSGNVAILSWSQSTYLQNKNGSWLGRMTVTGELLDGCGVQSQVSSPPSGYLDLAWGGDSVGVVDLRAGGQLYFQRFSESLQPIDVVPRQLTSGTTTNMGPKLTWAGGEWGVTFPRQFIPGYTEIAFLRVRADGTLVDPPGILQVTSGAELPGAPDRAVPDIAWSGNEYAIAYLEQTHPVDASGDIRVARVSREGFHLGSDALVTPDTLRNALFPEIAWNGIDYTMTWQDRTSTNGPSEGLVAHLGCNCTSNDSDGFSSCAGGDCDDTRSDIRPTAFEACGNGVDDNCDGMADCQDTTRCPIVGSAPEAVTSLMIAPDRVSLTWQPVLGALRYDVARGLLSDIDLERSVEQTACFAPDVTGTLVVDGAIPHSRDGYYYLVRSESGSPSSCRLSSWGVANETSVHACP